MEHKYITRQEVNIHPGLGIGNYIDIHFVVFEQLYYKKRLVKKKNIWRMLHLKNKKYLLHVLISLYCQLMLEKNKGILQFIFSQNMGK